METMDIRLTTGKTLSFSKGENILRTLKNHGIYLIASCGGKGICGKCRVRLLKGKVRVESTGKLQPSEIAAGLMLACQTSPEEDVFIEIPKESRLVIGEKIEISKSKDLFGLFQSFGAEISPIIKWLSLDLSPPTIQNNISDLERLKNILEEKGIKGMRFSHGFISSLAKSLRDANWKINFAYTDDSEAICVYPLGMEERYGLAVDIGTTTVVVYLVDLKGQLVDVGSTYNSQVRYGDDVITRIIYATENNGLNELREAVVIDINDLLAPMIERNNIKAEDIESVVISGNTTMSHLFWGLNPAYIREEPYIPTVNFFPLWKAKTAEININSQVPIYTVPCVASYVGGDIVAGVLASKMHRNSEISLFMDIGTNGEIVIGNNEWLVTAACSAGPCFEGSGIRHGMRATEGAIEFISIDPRTLEPTLGVIGNEKPMGICGSGMIDAISEMFLLGVIDQKGRFVRRLKTGRIREGPEGPEFLFFSENGRDIVLTQVDIENILRAKAAIYAGISLLLRKVGFTFGDIERAYIGGGFGNYLDIDKAIILGMLPDLPKEKFRFLGNTSVTGAYLCLLSGSLRREAEGIARKMTYVELSVSRRFMDEYMSALFLPHTEIKLFPTVEKLLSGK
ncbi:MAG: ASKHA domain-containing protein, partial [Nitrospirota bacterium]